MVALGLASPSIGHAQVDCNTLPRAVIGVGGSMLGSPSGIPISYQRASVASSSSESQRASRYVLHSPELSARNGGMMRCSVTSTMRPPNACARA
jgi:hypothetical protein